MGRSGSKKMPRDFSEAKAAKPRAGRDLLLVFDVLLAALFCVAPLVMGGRHEIGRTVFLALVGMAVLVWLVRAALQKEVGWHWSGAEPLLATALVLIIVQLISLPAGWLDVLSPELRASLPAWKSVHGRFSLGAWETISVAPSITQSTLVVYVAYAALFCAIVQRLESMDDIYRLLKLIAAASIVMAVVGLMQFVSGCTEYLGFYHHPARSAAGKVTGSFTNQNHYANFVALGLGPLVWWTYRAKLRARRTQQNRFLFPLSMLGLAVLSVLLSFSRGGVLVLAVAALTCAVVLGRRGLLNRRAITAIVVCVCLLATALLIYGYAPLAERLGSLMPGQSLRSASRERWDLWKADWTAAKDFLLIGSGAGTHAEVYPRYMPAQYNVRFTHAENSYLQVLLENGIVGLALLVAGISISIGWCIRILRSADRSVDAALGAGLLASLLATIFHAAVDFAWYIPACMTMAIGILAACCRASQLLRDNQNHSTGEAPFVTASAQRPLPIPRPIWTALGVAVAAFIIVVAPQQIGAACAAVHWDHYLRQSAASNNVLLHDNEEARGVVEKLISHLSHAVRNDPQHAQAWQRLAALNMRRFALEQRDAENAMDSAQLRDAVYASEFPSQDAADQWLSRAVGDNMRFLRQAAACAQQAAKLGAWRGDAYLYLAELSFLLDGRRELRDGLLVQAQIVRPYDGAVMFAVGVEDLHRGNAEMAMKRWKRAFHQNAELRKRIIEHLGPQAHPLVLIQAFAPDTNSLSQLFEIHRNLGQKEFAAAVAKHLEPALVRRAQRGPAESAATTWHQVADITWFVERQSRSLRYLTRAVEMEPRQFEWRRLLADRLFTAGDFSGAAAQYRLCLEHTPYDEALQRAMIAAEKKRIEQPETAQRVPEVRGRYN